MRLTKNFTVEELACPCCAVALMGTEFMDKLQILRTHCGFPFVVTSGYRCKGHNEEVSPNSQGDHTTGLAVDIQIKDRYKRASILKRALAMDYWNDIAIAKDFIHLGKGRNKQGIGVY